jgi:succinate-semialdehyde dehydrogenase/glutarate-semialdehyde dehydrogenase
MLNLTNIKLLQTSSLVDGQWLELTGQEVIDVVNPADGSVVAQVASAGATQTQQAIDAADKAQKLWRKRTAKERAALIKKWHDLLLENQEDLAQLMTAEQGKPLAESRGEIGYAASFLEWFAEEGKRIYGDLIPSYASDRRLMVFKEPVGVCAAITPWNFPAAMITRKVGPALAAGCTMVIKPAAETPLSALAMGQLAIEAGIPAGVVNIVVGDAKEIGQVLTSSPKVAKLTFTGSTPVGKLLMRACADTMKKVSLELGGNAPFIVFDDADIDSAVEGAMMSKFRNVGQTCVCANRIYVQSGVYQEFSEKFAQRVAALKVGTGTEEGVEQGPLISEQAVQKIEQYIDDALAKGGQVLTGGRRHQKGGTFFEPTVIINANADMNIAREEIFGPMAPIFKFESEEQVIALANDTEYGLASYFYSRDIGRIWRVAEALETGLVGVNAGVIATEVAPFGGYKESGLGREGSKYGIEDYINTKYVCIADLDK